MAVAQDWTVMAVFDPDQMGGDFAYTVGLAERGLPELHVWARPPDGDDPGEDWKFSARDCGHLLNECAERLIAGRLAVGDTWSQPYDGGLVRADFTIGTAVGRLDVEALATRPDALILPVRWSLHRAPVGRLGPIDEASEPQIRFGLERTVRALVAAARRSHRAVSVMRSALTRIATAASTAAHCAMLCACASVARTKL